MTIPEQLQEQWNYPAITNQDKRNILGLNSARLSGLSGGAKQAIGRPGSAYTQGNLANAGSLMQPGSAIDLVVQGPGYPTASTASLMPDDNITKIKAQYVGEDGGRSDNRFGWVRT